MKALRLAVGALTRSFRAGQLTVLWVALVVAVSALTSVGFFTDRVSRAVEREASVVLAADLRLRTTEPPVPQRLELARERGLDTAQVVTFPSVVLAGDESQLAAIHAVTDSYPLRGQLRTAPALFGEQETTDAVPGAGEAWADEGLIARLGVDVGAKLDVGSVTLTLTRVLEYRPDQAVGFVGFAPDLLINFEDLEATELVQPGSRITWSLLFAGAPQAIEDFRTTVEPLLKPNERLQTISESGEQIQSAITRAQAFLELAALIAVLLAATAVAVAARRYAQLQVDSVALLKCMGASSDLVLRVSLWELFILGLITGVIGSAIGFGAQWGIAQLLASLIEGGLPPAGPAPLAAGMITAWAVLFGFALPAMAMLRTVPPLRVLRRDAAPKAVSTGVSYVLAVLVVAGLTTWLIGPGRLLTIALAGLGTGAIALTLAGWLLVLGVAPLVRRAGVAWRFGLANIGRRRGESVAQLVAFGFGLAVLLLLTLIRTDLLDAWRTSLPEDAPNNFLINIQRDEVAGVEEVFADAGVPVPRLAPLVRARMTAINGESVEDIETQGQGRQLLNREANLTWAREIDPSNRLVAGEWWDADTTEHLVSVDDEVAADLGLKLGDTLTFGVAGQTVEAKIASFRRIQWDSFRPNFYLVLTPDALAEAPATFIAGAYVPADARSVLLNLVRRYPSVSVIDLESIISQVKAVIDRAGLAVQYVFLFTLAAGIVVLMAAVQATQDERRYETAMLRTLGASRRLVRAGVWAEFLGLGLLAGLLATAIAGGVGYLLAVEVFQLEYRLPWAFWVAGPVAGTALVGLSGALATRGVVSHPPVSVLRAQA